MMVHAEVVADDTDGKCNNGWPLLPDPGAWSPSRGHDQRPENSFVQTSERRGFLAMPTPVRTI